MTTLAEITFNLNLAQYISLPFLLALAGALGWFWRSVNRQLAPLSVNIQAAVDARFKMVTDAAAAEKLVATEEADKLAVETKEKQRIEEARHAAILTAIEGLTTETAAMAEHMKVANTNAADHSAEDIKRFGEIAVHLGNIEGRLGLPPGGAKK